VLRIIVALQFARTFLELVLLIAQSIRQAICRRRGTVE
jgi:hypothetical protein